jgi:hypothetical protein
VGGVAICLGSPRGARRDSGVDKAWRRREGRRREERTEEGKTILNIPGMSSSTVGKMQKLKGILADPGNRPAVSLLMYSSIAMAVVPLAVYFACFHILFAEGVSPEPPPSPRHCASISSSMDVKSIHCCTKLHRGERERGRGRGREGEGERERDRDRDRERERVRLSHVVGAESVPWREITTWCGCVCC